MRKPIKTAWPKQHSRTGTLSLLLKVYDRTHPYYPEIEKEKSYYYPSTASQLINVLKTLKKKLKVVLFSLPFKFHAQLGKFKYGIIFILDLKTIIMKEKTTKGRNQDKAKVAGGQYYEVNYEKDKLNVSAPKVKDTIKTAGNSRKKVENKLQK